MSLSNSNHQCEDDRLGLWQGKVRSAHLFYTCVFSSAFSHFSSDPPLPRRYLFSIQWNNQQLGWHESDIHEALRQYEDTLLFPDTSTTTRMLFPLCGKTVDMAYLATKYSQLQVVGVDGIAQALETFAKEQEHLNLQKQPANEKRWIGSNLELLQSDFFQMPQPEYAAYHDSFDIIFDRASLVAISPTLRDDYVQVCRTLLKPKGKIMLVVIERIAGHVTAGPPFSVTHEDVMRLYGNQDWVESVQLLEDQGEAKRNQVSTDMVSRYYWIQCK